MAAWWSAGTLKDGSYFLLVIQVLTGLSSANHHTNNVAVRLSPNPQPNPRAPTDYGSTYVSNARDGGTRAKSNWNVNSYYKNYTDQYTAYSMSSSAKYIRLTSDPVINKVKVRSTALEARGVCVNFEQLDPSNNMSYLGVFICPLAFEPLQNTYCCGNDYGEYCCEPDDFKATIPAAIAGPAIVGTLFLFVTSLGFYFCCCKPKDGKEEPLTGNDNYGSQPEEVKVVSRQPSKTKSDRISMGGQSENQTSCTSLGSEGDNGYGSGPLAETKPLDPAYPPATENSPEKTRTQDYQPTDPNDRKESPENIEPGKDEVADLRLSDPSLYEDPIA